MDKDELLRMLDLGKGLSKPSPTVGLTPQKEDRTARVGTSSTVLKLDRWDLARGAEFLETHKKFQDKVSPEAAADFFGLAYLPNPELAELCRDVKRTDYIAKLMETPDYVAMHDFSKMNATISNMTARTFVEEYVKLQEKEEACKKAGKQLTDRDIQTAVYNAVDKAEEETSDILAVARGCGSEAGDINNPANAKGIMEAYHRVRNDAFLRKVFERAGAFRLHAQGCQRRKVIHGSDELVGITLGGDVSKLTQTELAYLADDDFEWDMLVRLTENQCMVRDHRGVDRVGKGPVIVWVDESGSMSGPPLEQAKAFALAMAWIAKHQRRWCVLASYSSSRDGDYIVLKPGQWDEMALLDWVCHFYGGGTSMNQPFNVMPNEWWAKMNPPKGKTDMIVISDAIVHIDEEMQRSFHEFKKREKVKLISLVLEREAGDLGLVSDETYLIPEINIQQKAIDACFSI